MPHPRGIGISPRRGDRPPGSPSLPTQGPRGCVVHEALLARALPMRLLLTALALVVATLPARAQHVRVRVGIVGHPAPLAIDSLASVHTIQAPRAQVFHAVAQVLAELELPVDTRDSVRGMVGVTSIARMRRFANAPISRYLNCGSGITGANADNWRVFITAFAFVDARDAATTELRLAMVGGARDVAGSSTAPVACGSTGAFESLVAERVTQRLAPRAPPPEPKPEPKPEPTPELNPESSPSRPRHLRPAIRLTPR